MMTVKAHDVTVRTWAEGKVIEVNVSGKLMEEDCDVFVPVIDAGVEKFGQVRLLFNCVGFEGWTLGGLLEDAKFGLHHYNAIFRLAIVGDRRWEKAMATLCKPFTAADVNYYDFTEIDTARAWLREGT